MTTFDRRTVLQLAGAGAIGASLGTGSATAEPPVGPGSIPDGGTLRVGLDEDIRGFDPGGDPGMINMAARMAVISMIYERPFRVDAQGALRPWVIQSAELVASNDIELDAYENYAVTRSEAEGRDGDILAGIDTADDLVLDLQGGRQAVEDGVFGVEYRLNLREGITFHDGSELTAENVARTYTRAIGSVLGPDEFNPWLLDVEAVDYDVVRLYGLRPDATFLRSANLPIVPDAHLDLAPGEIDPRRGTPPIGCGPFVFDEYEADSHLILTRFDDHWFTPDAVEWPVHPDFPERPTFDVVEFDIIPETPTRSAALQSDAIDLTTDLPDDTLDDYDASELFTVWSAENGAFEFLAYPIDVEPWDDARIRQAVNHLIPRQEIVDELYSGWASPAFSRLPRPAGRIGTTDFGAHREEFTPTNTFDSDRAIELLEDAADGGDVEFPIEVTIEVQHVITRLEKAQLLAQAMENTGYFDPSVEVFAAAEWFQRIMDDYHEKGHLAMLGVSAGNVFDPDSYARVIHHSENIGVCCNLSGVDIDGIDDHLDAARYGSEVIANEQVRRQRYDTLWDELADLQATSAITFATDEVVLADRIGGFDLHPDRERFIEYGIWAPEDGRFAAVGDVSPLPSSWEDPALPSGYHGPTYEAPDTFDTVWYGQPVTLVGSLADAVSVTVHEGTDTTGELLMEISAGSDHATFASNDLEPNQAYTLSTPGEDGHWNGHTFWVYQEEMGVSFAEPVTPDADNSVTISSERENQHIDARSGSLGTDDLAAIFADLSIVEHPEDGAVILEDVPTDTTTPADFSGIEEGEYTITLSVSDSNAVAETTVTVAEEPPEPTIDLTVEPSTTTVDQGDTVEFDVTLATTGAGGTATVTVTVAEASAEGELSVDDGDDTVSTTLSLDTAPLEAGEYDWSATAELGVADDEVTGALTVAAEDDDDAVDPADDSDDVPPGDDDPGDVDDGLPGFGIAKAVSAIGGAAYVLKRRLDVDSEEP